MFMLDAYTAPTPKPPTYLQEVIRLYIEERAKQIPDYRFSHLQIEYKDGRYLATPVFIHKSIKCDRYANR